MITNNDSTADKNLNAALDEFISMLRHSGQQADQSYKLKTVDYFAGLRARLLAGDDRERAAVLDEISRSGKVAEIGLTPEELGAYIRMYDIAEDAMKKICA